MRFGIDECNGGFMGKIVVLWNKWWLLRIENGGFLGRMVVFWGEWWFFGENGGFLGRMVVF